jgi:glycosyltransferase involved in cell wall biosynthesis
LRLPYVVIVYDLYPDIAIALEVASPRNPLIKLWQAANRQIWRKAKGIIVLTPAMKQAITDTCREVAGKIVVIHNWADGDYIRPRLKQDNWFAQKYDLADKFTVLYSGNMGRCHDLMTIIRAAQYLQEQPIQFVFIGDGAQSATLKQEAKRLGLSNILFLPYQDKAVLPYSLTACDLSLISIADGMEKLVAPSKLYSTLAAGRPVAAICSQQSFLRDIVAEAKCGKSFANGDGYALAQFISDLDSQPEMTKQMGEAARQYFCDNFTRELAARQYLAVLQNASWRRQ